MSPETYILSSTKVIFIKREAQASSMPRLSTKQCCSGSRNPRYLAPVAGSNVDDTTYFCIDVSSFIRFLMIGFPWALPCGGKGGCIALSTLMFVVVYMLSL